VTAVASPPRSQLRLPAIGTYVHVLLTEPELLPAAQSLVVDELAELDRSCSRFRSDSELMRLVPGRNRVGPMLAAALVAALDVARDTGGLVQPTLGAALRAAGYDRTFPDVLPDGPASIVLPADPDLWQRVQVDGLEVTVPAGASFDLGATAKAWAADRIAARLSDLGTGALVNLGGDIAVAGPVPAGGWTVDIADRPGGAPLQCIAVESGGLATSSTTARTWRRGGQVLHHILDPVTGRSASPTWSCVSVVAPTCLAANAVSTAAVVLGVEAPEWVEATGLPACLWNETGAVVRLNGWPA
jgi:thiamine biosynthesis lipoprotein